METIGDSYMVVAGAPKKRNNHAESICDMALDMVEGITGLTDPSTGEFFNMYLNIQIYHRSWYPLINNIT